MTATERTVAPPAPATLPRTQAQWLERLAAVRLPLLSTPQALQRMLGVHISVRDLLELIEADLPLAAEVVLSASKTLRHSGKPLQGLQHAVNLLGVERVQGLVRARRDQRLDLGQPAHQAVLQSLATTRLACLFTNHWTALHAGTDPEPLIWTTALLGLVRWKLPLAAPHEAAEIERQVAAGHRRATAERALLGTTLDDLTRAHLRALGLPQDAGALPSRWLAEAARGAADGRKARQVSAACLQALHTPGAVCGIAQGLAQSAQDSWYTRRTRTWMAVAAVRMNQPLDRLRADLLQLALYASQETGFTRSLVAPAARLMWAPPSPRRMPDPVRAAAQPPAAAKLRLNRPDGVDTAVSTGTLSPAAGRPQDLRALFSNTVQTLTRTLGLRRCALFLKANDGPRLGCVFAHGFENTGLVRGLAVAHDEAHLTHRLLQRPAGFLWVRSAQVMAARRQLPASLAPLLMDSGLALGVVDIDGQPRGLWWVDTGRADAPLDAVACAGVQSLTRAFGADFARLTRPPSRPAAAPIARAA